MKLILDVMGGDHAPLAMLDGVVQALPELEGELVLVGDRQVVLPLLAKRRLRPLAEALQAEGASRSCQVRLVDAPEVIAMEDSVRAVRSKPRAPINLGCRMAAEDWKSQTPSAFISAGHSGVVMASALLNLGRLPGVERPAIAVKLPTLSRDGCVLLDVGANVDCKPEHLRDFAIMGALFAQAERSSPGLPRVGLLSNGEERTKGNDLVKQARKLIEDHPCFASPESAGGDAREAGWIGVFTGNAEGKEIFKGQVDVVVTDGFVGNVVLKSLEGLGSVVISILREQARKSPMTAFGFLLSSRVFRFLKRKLDYAEYGAAPLLGVAGYVFICHGRSDARAIKNALLRSQTAVRSRFVERLEPALAQTAARTGRSAKDLKGT